LVKLIRHFTKNNDNILFTRADKGKGTVAIERDEYLFKMMDLLSDCDTYIQINKDPTKKLTDDIRSLLTRRIEE